MTREEIKALTPVERVAGFVLASAKLAVVGARLRKDGRQDDTWTDEENAEWDNAADEIDPWSHALTEEDRKHLWNIEHTFACITNVQWPPKEIKHLP